MAREKLWYKIFLDDGFNGNEPQVIARVKSKGLVYLTINFLRTVYPEDQRYKLWFE